jgi:small conductance mechanosensitive channel
VDINLEVSYGVATEQVLELMRNAAKLPAVLETPAPVAVIKEYNATSITYGLMVWCKTADYWDVKFSVNRELSRLCQEAGITFYAPKMKIQLEK